jgi:hypothetical protein
MYDAGECNNGNWPFLIIERPLVWVKISVGTDHQYFLLCPCFTVVVSLLFDRAFGTSEIRANRTVFEFTSVLCAKTGIVCPVSVGCHDTTYSSVDVFESVAGASTKDDYCDPVTT